MSETNDKVRVELKLTDSVYIPTRTYRKTVTFDRWEWNEMDEYGRRETINELIAEFKDQTFDSDFEVLNADLNDPTT